MGEYIGKYWDTESNRGVPLYGGEVTKGCFDQIKDGDIIYVDTIYGGMGGSPDFFERRKAIVQNGQIGYKYLRERYFFNRETGRSRSHYIACWQPHDGRKIIRDDINFEI